MSTSCHSEGVVPEGRVHVPGSQAKRGEVMKSEV